MTYKYYQTVKKGFIPKNSPIYLPEGNTQDGPRYICSICGYVYDGETPFGELNLDYICPRCGAPKSMFEKFEKMVSEV